MVAPVYANKKGIYKNLYLEIDSDNKKKRAEEACYYRHPKGIYRDLYKHISGFKGKEEESRSSLFSQFILSTQTTINSYFSRMSYFFSSASSSLKMLMLACIIVRKPVNNYIENNINYLEQGYDNE